MPVRAPESDAAYLIPERAAINFTVHQLRFECRVQTPIRLNPHKGSALRGALFHALRGDDGRPDGFCINKREQFCHHCPYHLSCPISALLATVDEASDRGVDVPRPYTVEPPLEAATHYGPGDRLTFGLTLFAGALDLFPYVIVGVRGMEARGLGLVRPEPGGGAWQRGRFSVERIVASHPLSRQEHVLRQAGDELVAVPNLPVTHADVVSATRGRGEVSRLTLAFLTPTRLIDQGRLVHRPLFQPFILRLLERLDALSVRFSGGTLPIDRDVLLPLTGAVQVVDDATTWVELDSYSTRRGARSPIGGFVGCVTFAGPLTPFLPWILWGQFTHVGKDAVKGNGLYRVLLESGR